MIALTSISPKHPIGSAQQDAVDSWVRNGLKVYSFNHPDEISVLESQYKNVEFIPTYRTTEVTNGKPLVTLNALFDFAKGQSDEDVVIINSDILLQPCRGLLEYHFATHCDESIGIMNRWDYSSDDLTDAIEYIFGFDVFLIKKKHLFRFPQAIYCLGQTWWDFWVPYRMVQSGGKIHKIRGIIAMHRHHKTQWSQESWERMTKYFAWENDLRWSKSAPQTTGKILYIINTALKKNPVT